MAQQSDKSLYYAKLNLKSTYVSGFSLSNIDHIWMLMEIYVTQENYMQKFSNQAIKCIFLKITSRTIP